MEEAYNVDWIDDNSLFPDGMLEIDENELIAFNYAFAEINDNYQSEGLIEITLDVVLCNLQLQPSIEIISSGLNIIIPPEREYHVRYLSEIIDVPFNGNIIQMPKKPRKNLSGRYLKGIDRKMITISLPSPSYMNISSCNLYIRVSRLTVPYHGIWFHHPYPLLCPMKKKSDEILTDLNQSIYFRLSREDLRSQQKSFKNLMFTRLKQNELKNLTHIYALNDTSSSYSLVGENVKKLIDKFQLKKSVLDFRLCFWQNNEMVETEFFCRSDELIEIEGNSLRRSSSR